jgi:hypothetical protein
MIALSSKDAAMAPARRAALIAVCPALIVLAGCSPKPIPAAAGPARPPASKVAPAPPPAAPTPTRHAHMICRSSRDGRVVPCGTSDAMMVGIKDD